ncbi:MAG TPA: hypothetical protein VKH40_06910 [Alloacidobacterium sp.]|nr:hypothetical protein [Alloacidobacterium sp.]
MPNYLQRIVMSGARTTSTAKPPVSSRALIPPVIASARVPMTEEGPRIAEEFSELVLPAMHAVSDEPMHVTTHKPSPHEQDISATLASDRGEPSGAPVHNPVSDRISPAASDVAPFMPATGAVGVRVLAPKGLRRARAGNDRQQEITRAVEETLRAVSPRPPENRPEGGIPVESSLEASTITPGEMRQVAPDVFGQLQRKPSAPSPAPLTARIPGPRISAPVTDSKAQEVQIQAAAEALPAQILPVAQKSSPEVKPSRDAEQSSAHSPLIPKPVVEKQIAETRRFEERATAPRQAQPAVFAATDKRRRSQISIGRIDVQVNNLSAQPSTSPLPARQPARSNFLEARYLDRFFLKL